MMPVAGSSIGTVATVVNSSSLFVVGQLNYSCTKVGTKENLEEYKNLTYSIDV